MGLLACAFFLCAASAMIGPWWSSPAMLGLWLVAMVAAVRWFTPAPRRVVALGVGLLLAWVLLVPGLLVLG